MSLVKYAFSLALFSTCISFSHNGKVRSLSEGSYSGYEADHEHASYSDLKGLKSEIDENPFYFIRHLIDYYSFSKEINITQDDRNYLKKIDRMNDIRLIDNYKSLEPMGKTLEPINTEYIEVVKKALSNYLPVLSANEFECNISIHSIIKILAGFDVKAASKEHPFPAGEGFDLGNKPNHQFVLYTLKYMLSDKFFSTFHTVDSSQ